MPAKSGVGGGVVGVVDPRRRIGMTRERRRKGRFRPRAARFRRAADEPACTPSSATTTAASSCARSRGDERASTSREPSPWRSTSLAQRARNGRRATSRSARAPVSHRLRGRKTNVPERFSRSPKSRPAERRRSRDRRARWGPNPRRKIASNHGNPFSIEPADHAVEPTPRARHGNVAGMFVLLVMVHLPLQRRLAVEGDWPARRCPHLSATVCQGKLRSAAKSRAHATDRSALGLCWARARLGARFRCVPSGIGSDVDRLQLRMIGRPGKIAEPLGERVDGLHRRVRGTRGNRRRALGCLLRAAQARALARAADTHRGRLRPAEATRAPHNGSCLRPITMPRADQRLRSASSPISAAVRYRQRRNTPSGQKSVRHVPGLFCQLCPRPLKARP